jgi:hypothetical protein
MAGSGGELVLVDDAAEDVPIDQRSADGEGRARHWLFEGQAAVRSGRVVKLDVLAEDPSPAASSA